MSFALPVHRLYETETLLAFHHPQAAYPTHILIVPKKAIPSLDDLEAGDEFGAAFLKDLLTCTRRLVSQFNLAQGGYRLIVNGGAYQDVAQLHIHLVSEEKTTQR